MRLHLLGLALLASPLPAQAPRDSMILVNVTRTARIAPDRAALFVIVDGTAETAPDAVARVETKIKVVVEALSALGPRVQMERPMIVGVGPTPAPGGYPGVGSPMSHVARSVIRVHLSRPDHLAALLVAASAGGAAGTSPVSYELTSADSVRRIQSAEAMTTARADAEAVARSSGGRLGALVDVSVSGETSSYYQNAMINFDSRYGQQQITSPEVTVTTRMTVRYRLIR